MGSTLGRAARACAALAATLVATLATPMTPVAKAAEILRQDLMIASDTPGIDLFVRHKHRADVRATTGDRILLFVHGATYPAETAFDLPIEGVSMMDLFAERGYDVYLVDVRGYGRSTRMPELDAPPSANPPLVHTAEAARDLGSAVDYIRRQHGVDRINVMGWSWGTSIAGLYTSEHNDKVNRLVLYAPLWVFKPDTSLAVAPSAGASPSLGAYRLVSRDSAKERWLKGVDPAQRDSLIPPGVFDAWADATWATDPQAAASGKLRAPNGVIDDVMRYWKQGKPLYDPGRIRVPTFLIHAEWDADLPSDQAQGYFAALKSVPYKRFVELGEGTHTVMLEKNRMQFFREIAAFLDERDPLALK